MTKLTKSNAPEKNIPKTGCCRFCGQTKMIELTEDEWLQEIIHTDLDPQEIADIIAMEQCTCREGESWRHARQIMEQSRGHIEFLFREKYPEIADIFQEAKTLVWEGRIKKITASTQDSGTAVMYRSNEKLEIKFTQKKEMKMTAS